MKTRLDSYMEQKERGQDQRLRNRFLEKDGRNLTTKLQYNCTCLIQLIALSSRPSVNILYDFVTLFREREREREWELFS
jgi:hypothetical protein